MKAYFVGSIKGKVKYLANYKRIIEILKQLNLDVICEDVLNTTEELVYSLSDERRIGHYKEVLNWINSVDLVVAETSYPSIGVGFEISLALDKGKPVIVLCTEEYNPHFLEGIESDKLFIIKYNPDNLKETLKDVLRDVKEQMDIRFTMLLSPKIVTFLNKISKKKEIPKSVYIRRLIERELDKEK